MLKAHELVKLWEVTAGKQMWQKALLMLAAIYPDEPLDNLALLSLGNRNAKLFRLRESLFGTEMNANSSCSECDEKIEFQLDTQRICSPDISVWDGDEISLSHGAEHSLCRPANSYDLRDILPILEIEGPDVAERELVFRCILQFKKDSVLQPVETISDDLISVISDKIKKSDIHSQILCRINCPECENSWAEPFDIASYLWHEIKDKAQIILSEVQMLAKAFGWWEGDILSLSDIRRKYYLEGLNA